MHRDLGAENVKVLRSAVPSKQLQFQADLGVAAGTLRR